MKLAVTQNAFTSGAHGEKLSGRHDVNQRASAVAKLVNGVPIEQGPVIFRPGTQYINEVKHSDKYTILVEFRFSVDQAILLEVGHKYIRFYKDGALIIKEYIAWAMNTAYDIGDLVTQNGSYYRCLVEHTSENATAWVTATGYSIDDLVTESGNYYRCLEAHTSGTFATDLAANKWVLTDEDEIFGVALAAVDWEETAGANDVAYEIATPWEQDIVNELSFAGTADIIYVAHNSLAPRKITRYANDNWLLEEIVFEDGPFKSLNTDASKKVYVTAGTAPEYTITANKSIFDTVNDLGRLFQLQRPPTNLNDGYIAVFRITAVTSGTVATADLISGSVDSYWTTSSDPKVYFRFGAFSGQGQAATPSTPYTKLRVTRFEFIYDGTSYGFLWGVNNPVGLYDTLDTYNGKTRWERAATVKHQIRWNGVRWELWQPSWSSTSGGKTWNYGAVVLMYNDSVEANPPLGIGPDNGWYGANGYNYELDAFDASDEMADAVIEWPSVAGFFQERLYFGNTNTQPSTLFVSKTAAYELFAPTNEKNEVVDDCGFVYGLSGGIDVNEILWIKASNALIIGTSGGEFVARTSNESEPVTPTGVSFILQSERGSIKNQTPHVLGGQIIYVQRLGNIARSMDYDVATGRYKSTDITKFNDQILFDIGGYKNSSYKPEPSNTILYVGNNGKAALITLEPDDSVIAWTEIELGGDDVKIESTSVLPRGDFAYYDRYVLTRRVIDGETKRYIERFAQEEEDSNYWNYLDCSLEYHNDLVAIDAVTNLGYIEGETVHVFGDGQFIKEAVVAGGAVSLDGEEYNHLIIGIPYSLQIKLLDVEGQLEGIGSSMSKQKRLLQVTAQVLNTADLYVGTELTEMQKIDLESDTPVSGKFQHDIDDDFDLVAGDVYITHDSPYPCTIQTITREVEFRG